MTKVLLSNTNTIWGVIAKPQSSNVYRHVLSFDNEDIKEKFIDDKLFGGKSFKTLLNNSKPLSFAIVSAIECQFKIDPRDYANETMESLMNKDFAIVDNNGKISYYAITSATRSGQMVLFEGELDIFFTHDVKEMFNDNDVNITQAHIDRFYKNDNGEIDSIILDKTKIENNSIYQKEKFNIEDDNLIPYKKGELIMDLDYDKIIQIKKNVLVPDLTNEENIKLKEIGVEYINNLAWEVVAINDINWFKVQRTIDPTQIKTFHLASRSGAPELPFYYFTTPCSVQKDLTREKIKSINVFNSGTGESDLGIGKEGLESPYVVKNSLKILPVSPLVLMEDVSHLMIFTINVQSMDSERNMSISIQNDFLISEEENLREQLGFQFEFENDKRYVNGFTITKPWDVKHQFKSNLTKSNLLNISLDINKESNLNFETKTELSPYRKFIISSLTNNKKQIVPEFLLSNEISGFFNSGYIIENWGWYIIINNYFNIYDVHDMSESGYQLEDIGNFNLPTSSNEYADYIIRNKSQQNTSLTSSSVGAGVGLLGALLAPVTSGASLGITALAGASIATRSASDISQQLAKRKDISNTPNKINSNGSTFSLNNQYKPNILNIWEYKLPPQELKLIQKHLVQYGSSIGDEYKSINNILKSRYYFNHIEVDGSFENIKLQASAEIKQIINDTLESGVTIWHVRDLTTFKGIKNYDYENVEMSLLGANNDNKK